MVKQTIDDQLLRHWPLDKLHFLHLEMGMQCNVRCAMCYQTDFSPRSRLSEAVWREKLVPAYEKARTLVIVGGEPTVIPSCRKLVEMTAVNHPHLKLDMATNGVLFRDFWVDAFIEHGSCINFSFHSVNPDLYARVVKFGNLAHVIKNVDNMVRRKAETGSEVIVRISVVATDDTVLHIPDFVAWGAEHGLDQVLVMTDQLSRFQNTPISQVRDSISRTYEIADANPQMKVIHLDDFDWFYARMHSLEPLRQRIAGETRKAPCPTAFDGLYINDDGAAKPCCKSWYLFGNLVHQSLEEVWNSPAAYLFRKRMLNMDFRDCTVACDLNANPIDHRIATMRKAYWVFRRNPRTAVAKGLRKLGLTSAQTKTKSKP
jgi:MoaA/NifB/PqqE/SkfB family radical SAM enzyme